MPWLPIFVDEHDAKLIIHQLNQDEEIAFLVPDGRGKWKAVSCVTELEDGEYSLWHVPSGSLPLWCGNSHEGIIANPWEGWTEPLAGGSLTRPNSGINHPGVILLTLDTRHQPYSEQEVSQRSMLNARLMQGKDILSASDFTWIRTYRPTPQQTQRWWRRFKYWVTRQSIALPSGDGWNFWAFPSAFDKLKHGMEYSANGWDLTMALCEAEEKMLRGR